MRAAKDSRTLQLSSKGITGGGALAEGKDAEIKQLHCLDPPMAIRPAPKSIGERTKLINLGLGFLSLSNHQPHQRAYMDYKVLKGLILENLKLDWNCSNKLIQMMLFNKGFKYSFEHSNKFNDRELRDIAVFLKLIAEPVKRVTKKPKKKRYQKKQKSEKDFYNSQAWKEVRYIVLKRDGRRCVCCGATPDDFVKIHVDHIKPRSKFPELELDPKNLQILCADCNLGKSNTDSIDWRVKMIDDISKYH